MSTKRNPGLFDCYAKLGPDEPYFVIRAKDPVGPSTVHDWVRRRLGRDGHGNPKLVEALVTAAAMEGWRLKHMSGQPCGCDLGTTPPHVCDVHRHPDIVTMRALLAGARTELQGRISRFNAEAAAIIGAVGEISIEAALDALRLEAERILE